MKPYVLVVRQLGGVGDVLMLSCVFRGLKERYPRHRITLATAQIYLAGSLMDLAEHNPFIDEIHVVEPYDMTTQRTKEVWSKYFSNCPNLEDSGFWKQAEIRVDLNTACVDYEWAAMRSPEGITKPRYQVWCEAARVKPSSYAPVYVPTQLELQQAQSYLEGRFDVSVPMVAVGLSACDKKRAIGIGKLTEICDGLRDRGVLPITVDTTNSLPGIEAIVGKRVREIIPILAQMDAVVSVDSGILHMAGAVGVPVIGIFGPTDQRMRMGNYLGSAIDCRALTECSPCWYEYPCLQGEQNQQAYACFSMIPASVIVEETLRWVDKTYSERAPHRQGVL